MGYESSLKCEAEILKRGQKAIAGVFNVFLVPLYLSCSYLKLHDSTELKNC